jgi:hypothetical protein
MSKENQMETAVESTSAAPETSPVTATPAVEASTSPNANATSASTEASAAVPQEYTPNYKYKVMDKELEFDDFVRGAIKSQDHEKKLRELYEKASGIEEIKKAREAVRSEFGQYKQQWEPWQQKINQATNHFQRAAQALQKKDATGLTFHFGNVLNELGIPKEMVQNWVFNELQREDASPELKQQYNRQQELEYHNLTMQEQLSQFQRQQEDTQRELVNFKYNQAISKSEIAPMVEAFNQRMNNPQAFQMEVAKRGLYARDYEKRNMTMEEAVQDVIKAHGLQANPQVTVTQNSSNVVPHQPPTIPSVKGSSGSPAAKVPQSLDDLRKIAKEKFG